MRHRVLSFPPGIGEWRYPGIQISLSTECPRGALKYETPTHVEQDTFLRLRTYGH